MSGQSLTLHAAERAELERCAHSRAGRADDARVVRVLLLLTDGATYREVAEKVECCAPFISKWKHWSYGGLPRGQRSTIRGEGTPLLHHQVRAQHLVLSTSHEAANRLGPAQGRSKERRRTV